MKKTKEYQAVNVFRSSKFQPDEFDNDKDRLTAFYQRNGYKDVKVLSDSSYPFKNNLLNLDITISEGDKYYFRNITWAGNTKYSSNELTTILGIRKGDVYNPEILERNLYINQGGIDVTSLYMDDGYLFFNVTPVETKIEHDSVDMEIRIFEGPQATINKVTVSGNTKTHDHVILRELRTKPGQKFSRSDIIRSQRELAQLGYFDPEKMNVVPKPNPKDGTVDLEYTVVEKPSDKIELSGGYGAGSFVGVLGLTLENFSIRNIFKKGWQGYPSGDGQRVSIRAQSNTASYQSVNFSFTEPWFGGKKPNSFTFSAFASRQHYIGSDGRAQDFNSPGISIGLGKRLKWPDDYFVLYHSLEYQYYTLNNFSLIGSFNTGYTNNISFRHLLTRNSTNDPIYPSSGSTISFQLQWTPPYSLFKGKDVDYAKETDQEKFKFIEYHKWKFDGAYYMGFGKKKNLVLMTGVDFGLIGLYNQALGYTPFERFYVGGDGLAGYYLDGRELVRLRGYENANALTPEVKDLNGNVIETGATIYNKYTVELRYPFVKSQAATIWGLAFVEGGNGWNRFQDYNPFDIRRSFGAGIRLYVPMLGLFGFDWGYGIDPSLDPTAAKAGSNFHFYIGGQP
jgi:outer membrane protein insertion porin family